MDRVRRGAKMTVAYECEGYTGQMKDEIPDGTKEMFHLNVVLDKITGRSPESGSGEDGRPLQKVAATPRPLSKNVIHSGASKSLDVLLPPTEVPPPGGEMQKTELDPAGLTFRTDGNVRASFGDRSLVVRAPGLDAGWTIQFDFPADEKTSFKVAVGKAFKVKLDLRESPLKFAGAGMVEAVRPGEARVVFQSLQVSFDGEESMDNIELPVTVTASGSGQVPVGTLKISVSPGEEVEE